MMGTAKQIFEELKKKMWFEASTEGFRYYFEKEDYEKIKDKFLQDNTQQEGK